MFQATEVHLNRRILPFHLFGDRPPRDEDPSSLSDALRLAWRDMFKLLFQPFDAWRWVRLSLVCLVLGGGTLTAAFNWLIGILPSGLSLRPIPGEMQAYVGRPGWLMIPAMALVLAVFLALLYLRSVGRLVLVDAVIRNRIEVRGAAAQNHRLARSYFLFLLSGLAILGCILAAVAIASFPYLQSGAAAATPSLAFSITLAFLLGGVVVLGAVFGLVVTLSDDLVVPIMYAERLPLPGAWHQLLRRIRRESGAFAIYVLVRIGLSVAIGATVLFFLFPTLLAIFSGAVFLGGVATLSLRVAGVAAVWNAATIVLALIALLVLTGVLLFVLSIAGMPGQVFLQGFGIRFIAPRFPSLSAILNTSESGGQEAAPRLA